MVIGAECFDIKAVRGSFEIRDVTGSRRFIVVCRHLHPHGSQHHTYSVSTELSLDVYDMDKGGFPGSEQTSRSRRDSTTPTRIGGCDDLRTSAEVMLDGPGRVVLANASKSP